MRGLLLVVAVLALTLGGCSSALALAACEVPAGTSGLGGGTATFGYDRRVDARLATFVPGRCAGCRYDGPDSDPSLRGYRHRTAVYDSGEPEGCKTASGSGITRLPFARLIDGDGGGRRARGACGCGTSFYEVPFGGQALGYDGGPNEASTTNSLATWRFGYRYDGANNPSNRHPSDQAVAWADCPKGANAASRVGGELAKNGDNLRPIPRDGAVLDANAIIGALERNELAAVDAALAGRQPVLPFTAVKEFLKKGDKGALREFMSARGSRISFAARESVAADLRAEAGELGRSLRPKDSRVAASAIAEGLPVLTRDKKFFNFLSATGRAVERY